MRRLVVTFILLCFVAAAQELPAKYLTNDGRLAVFLEATSEGLSIGLALGYGLLLPVDARLEGNRLTGTVADDLQIEGVIEGNSLRLSLTQESERHDFVLTRQEGKTYTSDGTALLDLLSLVPDTLTVRQGTPLLSFVNFRSAFADSVLQPQTREEFAAMTEDERESWLAALRRLRSGPTDLLQYALPMTEGMPDLLGFEWFDIDAALSYGTPPNMGTLLTTDANPEVLAERLKSREFEYTSFEGVAIWQRQDDAQVNLARREPGDPFVGPLGMAARIAVFPEHLANTRFSSMTQLTVNAFQGTYPSLAQAPEFLTLAEAVTAEGGELIQLQFLSPLAVGYVPDDPFAILSGQGEGQARPMPSLPPYGLAAIADLQEESEQVSLIALLYDDSETAELAAAELTRNLTTFHAAKLFQDWEVQIEEPAVHESADGLWAAVAAVRYPSPAFGAESGVLPGGVFAAWLDALFRREFHPLMIGTGSAP